MGRFARFVVGGGGRSFGGGATGSGGRSGDRANREARPATWANVRLARQKLEAERGERLDEDELLDAMAQAVLAGGSIGARSRAQTQVAVTICRDCGVARQAAAGAEVALRPEELECALCDAEWIDLDGERRARQDVTPAVRKAVRHRDGDRCRAPGCRAARNIDVHHIVHRAQGGSHHPENLMLLCGGHHKAHHRGELKVSGTASDAVFTWADAERNNLHVGDDSEAACNSHVEDDDEADAFSDVGDDDEAGRISHVGNQEAAETSHVGNEEAVGSSSHVGNEDAAGSTSHVGNAVRADAELALETLGFTRRESRSAVERALASAAAITGLESLIRAALRWCRPGS